MPLQFTMRMQFKQLGIQVFLILLLFGKSTNAKRRNGEDIVTNEYAIHQHNYEEENVSETNNDLHAQEMKPMSRKINSNQNSVQRGKRGSQKYDHLPAAMKPVNRKKKHIIIKIHPSHKKSVQRHHILQEKQFRNPHLDDIQEFHTFEETHEHLDEKLEQNGEEKFPIEENQSSSTVENYDAPADKQLEDAHTEETQHFHSEEEKHEKSKKIKIKHHHHHHHHNHVKEIIKKVPEPYPVEKVVHVPVEKIVEKIVHVPKPYPVEKIVEKVVKVPVEKIVHVPKPYPVEKIVEKKVPYPVEKLVHVPVEKIVEKKVPYPVEKIVHVPIEKVVEKIVHVPKPYPVEKIVEKIVHVPVEKIIEKKIPITVEKKVPYPVEKIVHVPIEKIVEKIVHVPQPYPVEKIVNKFIPVPKPYAVVKPIPYPVEVKVPYQVEKPVPYTVEKQIPVPYKVEVEKKVPVYIHSKEPYKYEHPPVGELDGHSSGDSHGHAEKSSHQEVYGQHHHEVEPYHGQSGHDLSGFPSNNKPSVTIYKQELIHKQNHQPAHNFNYNQKSTKNVNNQQHSAQETKKVEVTIAPPQVNSASTFRIHVPDLEPSASAPQPEITVPSSNDPSSDLLTEASTNSVQLAPFQSIALPFQFIHYQPIQYQQPIGFTLSRRSSDYK
uniref:Uncharacterized protein n=1 Tax=Glossina brevipalpis TaxID=37001 RepID=A0A1A9W5C6_9MUSC